MDQIKQKTSADELTRNFFVERAVEAYQENLQNEAQKNHNNNQPLDHHSLDLSNQSADVQHSQQGEGSHQATESQLEVTGSQQATGLQRSVNNNQQSHADRHILSELQARLRRRNDATRQIATDEPIAQQSPSRNEIVDRVYAMQNRPRIPPKPERMRMQNRPPLPPRRTRSERIGVARSDRTVNENETNPVFTRSFSAADGNQTTLDSFNSENPAIIVEMNDAEAISRLVEIGFGSTAATVAYNRAGRNLEDAIDSLLGQNSTDL